MLKVFGWLSDRQGPGYYRMILPATELAKAGHALWLSEEMPEPVKNGEADAIIGQRVCLPGASVRWQQLARAGHTKLVFETDDALHAITPDNRAAAEYFTPDMVRRYRENMAVADVITVSTPPLAEYARTVNPTAEVHVLPNCVPGWLHDHDRPSTSDRITIGWRGGSSHSRDFGELAAPLRRFLQHPDNRGRVEFHSIGADYTTRVSGRHAVTRHTPWTPSTPEFLRTVDFDLGVIPLRPSVFNDAKSDIAVLELAALGIPAIASSTGPYRRAEAAGCPVLLASNPREWTEHLTGLANEPERRTQLGKAAKEWAANRTIEDNAWRWAEAYGGPDAVLQR